MIGRSGSMMSSLKVASHGSLIGQWMVDPAAPTGLLLGALRPANTCLRAPVPRLRSCAIAGSSSPGEPAFDVGSRQASAASRKHARLPLRMPVEFLRSGLGMVVIEPIIVQEPVTVRAGRGRERLRRAIVFRLVKEAFAGAPLAGLFAEDRAAGKQRPRGPREVCGRKDAIGDR